ncbi:ABC transporter permease [Bacillus salacetis]|uniref:ABC transporter permease n=1 Tax=Bacillus salacetis TaxID=2315464 RepID=UPI003B9FA5C8
MKFKGVLAGSSILLVILAVSIVWPLVKAEPAVQVFLYDEAGKLVDTPPYSPSEEYWLGADREGNDLFYTLVAGAKWTLLFALTVTTLRVLISVIIGLFSRRLFSTVWVGGFMQAFNYIPQSLLAIIWLAPFLLYELRTKPPLDLGETLVLQIVVLTLVGIPTLTRMVAETTDHIYTFEFMESARILGGSRWHIARVHVLPHLLPRMAVLYGRQLVQVLTLILHLAIFHIFLGGTIIRSGQEHDQFNNYYTQTFEWAGLIGSRYEELLLEPFIIFFPVMAYSLLILVINMIVNGIEEKTTL